MKLTTFGSLLLLLANAGLAATPSPAPTVTVAWDKTISVSKTTFGIQVCPEPPLRRGASIHDPLWAAMRDAKVDMARLQAWFPYPKIGVAELEPPKDGKTSWDFSLIDPIVEDFMNAAEGRPVMLNFSTIPQWMFVTDKPVRYPSDPNEIDNNYGGGNQLRDPSMKELVGYYHRFLSWYLKGGFTDEYGKWHPSGHHYKVTYWEVLNEVDQEHTLTPAQYTAMYDAIVADLHQLDPSLKFSGPALAFRNTAFIRYFLDPAHHAPGIPLDMYSFHFYSQPKADESLDVQQHTIFNQADTLMVSVEHMDDIRRQFSPNTKLFINELGSFSNTLVSPASTFPDRYWTLTAGLFAYLYPRLVEKGVDYIGAAELIDYPGQAADTTLVDWNTGRPNARYWAMRLLNDNFHPGDRLVSASHPGDGFDAHAFVTAAGQHKILLLNMSNHDTPVDVPGAKGASIEYVDQTTNFSPARSSKLESDRVVLSPEMIAVLTLRTNPPESEARR